MGSKSAVANNIPADLNQSWHIPRPTLARSSQSSQGSTSSTNSTQSAKSGSLLLTAANLARIHKQEVDKEEVSSNRDNNLRYYLERNRGNDKKDPETTSVASSMHFTVVNMNTRPPANTRGFCRKHQLTILVVTMSFLFSIGIIAAVWFLEMRARRQTY